MSEPCEDCDGHGIVSACCWMGAEEVTKGHYQCSLCHRFCKVMPCECEEGE